MAENSPIRKSLIHSQTYYFKSALRPYEALNEFNRLKDVRALVVDNTFNRVKLEYITISPKGKKIVKTAVQRAYARAGEVESKLQELRTTYKNREFFIGPALLGTGLPGKKGEIKYFQRRENETQESFHIYEVVKEKPVNHTPLGSLFSKIRI